MFAQFGGIVRRLGITGANVTSNSNYAGIFAGELTGTMSDCFIDATSRITSSGGNAVAAFTAETTDNSPIYNSYSAASVTSKTSGGVIPGTAPASGVSGGYIVTNSFFHWRRRRRIGQRANFELRRSPRRR